MAARPSGKTYFGGAMHRAVDHALPPAVGTDISEPRLWPMPGCGEGRSARRVCWDCRPLGLDLGPTS
eukprot:12831610-Alexandrium_andersonii.AAC.1